MYSSRYETALNLAGIRHADQVRKGTGAPYLVHLVHVAAILARAGYDEDTQIVGLLHDVLEDTTSGPRDIDALTEHIRATFGSEVAIAVQTLSEPKRGADGQRLPWRARKDQYLRQLATGAPMALRVSAADKLHNLATLAEELRVQGDQVWNRFKVGPEGTGWFYRSVFDVLREKLDEPIVDALGQQLLAMDVFG